MPRRRDLKNIPKDVYRELYHFCLQYGTFQTKLKSCYTVSSPKLTDMPRGGAVADQVSENAGRALQLRAQIDLIEQTAREVCPAEYRLLLMAVTRDISFVNLKTRYDMQMGKERFQRTRRAFFYRLAEKTGRI